MCSKRILFFLLFLNFCGINPKSNHLLLISRVISTNTPQFLSISPVVGFKSNEFQPEFLIRYYVTNEESSFIGYNLYISTSTLETSSENQSNLYKENGIEPSFPHIPNQASTVQSSLQTRKILYKKAAPSPIFFEKCKIYSFSLKAVLNNGEQSNISKKINRCSVLESQYCPKNSSCNPDECTNSSCSESQKIKCPVGTLCNPCLYKNNKNLGCLCPEGEREIGCYK